MSWEQRLRKACVSSRGPRVTKSLLLESATHLTSCMMADTQHENKTDQCMRASFNERGLKGLSL